MNAFAHVEARETNFISICNTIYWSSICQHKINIFIAMINAYCVGKTVF